MAFLLDGKPLRVDVPFTYGDIHYPANWLRLSTAQEKKDLGITEVADAPTYDSRFYWGDGTAKALDDVNATDDNGDLLQFQTRERNRSDLSGLNFNIGVLYEPMITEKLKLTSAFRYTPKSTLVSDNERIIETVRVNPVTGFVGTSALGSAQAEIITAVPVTMSAMTASLGTVSITSPSWGTLGWGEDTWGQ